MWSIDPSAQAHRRQALQVCLIWLRQNFCYKLCAEESPSSPHWGKTIWVHGGWMWEGVQDIRWPAETYTNAHRCVSRAHCTKNISRALYSKHSFECRWFNLADCAYQSRLFQECCHILSDVCFFLLLFNYSWYLHSVPKKRHTLWLSFAKY